MGLTYMGAFCGLTCDQIWHLIQNFLNGCQCTLSNKKPAIVVPQGPSLPCGFPKGHTSTIINIILRHEQVVMNLKNLSRFTLAGELVNLGVWGVTHHAPWTSGSNGTVIVLPWFGSVWFWGLISQTLDLTMVRFSHLVKLWTGPPWTMMVFISKNSMSCVKVATYMAAYYSHQWLSAGKSMQFPL
jgi:hypothetical protein